MCTPYYTLAYNIRFTCRKASTEHVMLNYTTTLLNVYMDLVYYIYLFGVLKHFHTVQVISQWLVLWAEETSTYSWSKFCTVNC